MREKLRITVELIMQTTNNGCDVFEKELGAISNKNICSPLRNGDVTPSFRVKQSSSGIWIFVDYGGNQETGNCITFIEKRYNLSFKEALDKINHDFNILKNYNDKTYIPIKVTVDSEQSTNNKKKIVLDAEDCKFTDAHKKYFEQYHLDEFLCNKYDVYAVKKYALNKKIINTVAGEYHFVYVYKDITEKETGELKILRLGKTVKKENKWMTNVPNSKLWYLYLVRNDSPLFITKSNKDCIVLFKQGVNAVCTQSENNVILSKNIPYLKTLNDTLVLNFGSDEQGKKCSIVVSREHNLKWFNTPNNVLKYGVEDNANYVKEFGEESFKQLLKIKKWI